MPTASDARTSAGSSRTGHGTGIGSATKPPSEVDFRAAVPYRAIEPSRRRRVRVASAQRIQTMTSANNISVATPAAIGPESHAGPNPESASADPAAGRAGNRTGTTVVSRRPATMASTVTVVLRPANQPGVVADTTSEPENALAAALMSAADPVRSWPPEGRASPLSSGGAVAAAASSSAFGRSATSTACTPVRRTSIGTDLGTVASTVVAAPVAESSGGPVGSAVRDQQHAPLPAGDRRRQVLQRPMDALGEWQVALRGHAVQRGRQHLPIGGRRDEHPDQLRHDDQPRAHVARQRTDVRGDRRAGVVQRLTGGRPARVQHHHDRTAGLLTDSAGSGRDGRQHPGPHRRGHRHAVHPDRQLAVGQRGAGGQLAAGEVEGQLVRRGADAADDEARAGVGPHLPCPPQHGDHGERGGPTAPRPSQ